MIIRRNLTQDDYIQRDYKKDLEARIGKKMIVSDHKQVSGLSLLVLPLTIQSLLLPRPCVNARVSHVARGPDRGFCVCYCSVVDN